MSDDNKTTELESIYSKHDTVSLVRVMGEYKRRKEDAEEKLKLINQHYDYLRYTMVPQRFDDEGIKNTNIEGVGRVALSSGVYASIKPDMKSAAHEYLSDTGHGDIITSTINSQTLAATIKAMIQKGEDVPEEMFTITPWTRASITKS